MKAIASIVFWVLPTIFMSATSDPKPFRSVLVTCPHASQTSIICVRKGTMQCCNESVCQHDACSRNRRD